MAIRAKAELAPPHATGEDDSLQSKMQVYGFKPKGGDKITFPGRDEDHEAGSRLIRHARPYRHGAKLDTTGAEPRTWNVEAIFNNTIQEPGVDGPIPLYPDRMAKLMALVSEYDTGDFFHPIDGHIRARLEKASRSIRADETDTAIVRFNFVEDNEENVDARAIAPSISGSAIRLTEETSFTAELEDLGWNGSIEDLKELGSEIEGLMRAPGRAADDLDAKLRSLVRAADSILQTREEVETDTKERALSPPAPSMTLALERLIDRAFGAGDDKLARTPRARSYRVNRTTTIYAISSAVKQPVDALLDLNAQRIEDPLRIEPGNYRVYDSWP
jgi:prophage DNA circulation protein